MTEENLKGCDIPKQLNFSDWAVCMYALVFSANMFQSGRNGKNTTCGATF